MSYSFKTFSNIDILVFKYLMSLGLQFTKSRDAERTKSKQFAKPPSLGCTHTATRNQHTYICMYSYPYSCYHIYIYGNNLLQQGRVCCKRMLTSLGTVGY